MGAKIAGGRGRSAGPRIGVAGFGGALMQSERGEQFLTVGTVLGVKPQASRRHWFYNGTIAERGVVLAPVAEGGFKNCSPRTLIWFLRLKPAVYRLVLTYFGVLGAVLWGFILKN